MTFFRTLTKKAPCLNAGALFSLVSAISIQVHAATYTVTNTNDSGAGSLRQAIVNANSNAGLDTINFNIGFGQQTIFHGSELPEITDAVTIDGSTQPGFTSTPLIEIRGMGVGLDEHGFMLGTASSGSAVKSLILSGFGGDAIHVLSSNNAITGCYLGTNAAGTAAFANNGNGITVSDGSNNTIGGPTAEQRNIISGNLQNGIRITGPQAETNSILGNYIGTNAAGTAGVGNGAAGIRVDSGASSNIIGGSESGSGNVVSGNDIGVLFSESSLNAVHGNYIGTDAAGNGDIGNTSGGIEIGEDCHDNDIGHGEAFAGNLIAFNGGHAVSVHASALRNSLSGNSIHSHDSGEGIELYGDSHGQVAPVLQTATSDGSTVYVSGNLTSAADTTYRLEFFLNHRGGNSVQGELYLGATTITTAGNGEANFGTEVTGDISDGDSITSTATVIDDEETDETHATSEYSAALEIAVNESAGGSCALVSKKAIHTQDRNTLLIAGLLILGLYAIARQKSLMPGIT